MKKIIVFITLVTAATVSWMFYKDQPTHIALISDIDHCTSRNPVNEKTLKNVTSGARAAKAKALISLGDNISHRLGECTKTAKDDLPFITQTLRSFGQNTFFVLGDHDIASSIESAHFWKDTTHTEQNKGKNYFSIDIDDVHIVILDTILGGDEMAESCKTSEKCLTLLGAYEKNKARNPTSTETKESEKVYRDFKKKVSLTRSADKRDKGRLGTQQLAWLKKDLNETSSKKILVLSDHPLFAFTSERKSYDIIGREEIQMILQEKNKQDDVKVIAISGEAHLWHRETIEDVDYYILDEFKKGNAWALLSWSKEPFIEKIIEGKQEQL